MSNNDRKKLIGGTDVGCILGLNPYKTPLQLWSEKVGRVEPKDLSDVEAVTLGIELEDFVAKKFQKETGMKVRRTPYRYTHKKYDYMSCQVDRLIEATDELLEVKTCSAYLAKKWENEEIPAHYICQVMWQLGLTGRKVGWIAVLIGGQSFKYKRIDFDQEFFSSMVGQVVNFWDMVKTETPPMAIGADNDTIVKVYPENDDQIQQVEEFNDQIALLQETKMHIKEMQKEKDSLEASIKQRIGENLGIKTFSYTVKWNKQIRSSIDIERLKADGFYDKYKKTNETRVMRVSKNKGQENVNSR